jgi:hypothetical protein
MFATEDDPADEPLTRAVAEIFLEHGLVLPAYVAITINGGIILRPVDGHEGAVLN